jgi:hypothetical protein
MSGPSHFSGHSFVDSNLMTSDDYRVLDSEVPDTGVAWPETYDFAAQ